MEAIVDAIEKYSPEDDEPDMTIVNFDVGPVTRENIKEAAEANPKLQGSKSVDRIGSDRDPGNFGFTRARVDLDPENFLITRA